MIHGFATPSGTRRYAESFPKLAANAFFEIANDLHVSTLGLGTYPGDADDATDREYEDAILTGMRSGINFFDTALNYRDQRSEKAIGAALRIVLNANEFQRDQIVLGTKAGFLTEGAVPEWLEEKDVAGGIHSMHPEFLEEQVVRSRANLDMDTVDILYIHNPEVQLRYVDRAVFEQRLQAAFEKLERLVKERKIRWYGAATWSGFRAPGEMELERVIGLARYVGGDEHHFRFIQLPFNLDLLEAYQNRDHYGVSLLKVAERGGVTVVGSSTLNQASLAAKLPEAVQERIPGLSHNASRAIQFARSTPGISVALVGMSAAAHVRENLEIAGVPPMGTLDYEKIYRTVAA